MNNPEADGLATANQPVDETDFVILGRVRQLFNETDPMPDEDAPVLAVRGEERSRTITFESDSLVIMIRVGANPDGTARLDGWLDPPGARQVEVSTSGPPLTVLADEDGRFAFGSVPRGRAQLTVRPESPGPAGGRAVITPELIL